jgi:hypothetical protein
VFGPRTGVGKGVMDGEGVVHWDEDGVRVSGESVEALMHTAILGAKWEDVVLCWRVRLD